MNYEGEIYVFDLDDTLVWSPHWYDEAVLDSNKKVVAPGRSISLKRALFLIEKAKDYRLPERYKNMSLKRKFKRQNSDKNIYFELLDSNDEPIEEKDLAGYISPKELELHHIKTNVSYSPYLSVSSDYSYYETLSTVGEWGFNPEMIKLYKQHHPNVVVLTARSSVPGMNERIKEVLSEVIEPPKAIFTRPPEVINAGREKGRIISAIASIPEVTLVHFFDDNRDYIENAQHMIERYNLSDKVNIYHVDSNAKPNSSTDLMSKIINLANTLNREGLVKVSEEIDKILENTNN